jgi:hypothetical protein
MPQKREAATWVPLLQEVISTKGHCRWPLRGQSMRPTLPPECEIDVAPLPPHVPLGSLIVFANGDALVAHRLVRRAGGKWITQGDNRRSPDRALDPTRVLGLVRAAYLPNQQQCWPSALSGALAWFWIARYHMFRAVRFVVRSMQRIP